MRNKLIPKKLKGNPIWAQPAWTYHISEEPTYEGGMLPEVDISAKPMSEFRKKWRRAWNMPIMVPATAPNPSSIATYQYNPSNLMQTTPKQEIDYLAGLAAPIAPYLTSAYFLDTGVKDMAENGVNVGNSIQVGLSSLPFAPYAISGVKQASPYIARGVDAGLSSLGNKGAKARIIGREFEKLINETPVNNIASKSPQISFRTRVGDVEIDNPNLYYRQVGKGGGENFLTTGYAYTPQETENLLGYWNGTFKPTFRQTTGLDPGFTLMRPMYSQGSLWFPYGEGDLIVTSKPLRLADSKGGITSNMSKAGSRRLSEYKGEVTPENAKVFTFEPGYGYRRVENTSSLNISPKDISLAQQIESPISKPNFSDISHTKTSPSYGQQSTDKLIIRTTQDNGKVRLSLPTHTAEKPRQFVLEPAGDNKFYVHMRTWDGDHIPANPDIRYSPIPEQPNYTISNFNEIKNFFNRLSLNTIINKSNNNINLINESNNNRIMWFRPQDLIDYDIANMSLEEVEQVFGPEAVHYKQLYDLANKVNHEPNKKLFSDKINERFAINKADPDIDIAIERARHLYSIPEYALRFKKWGDLGDTFIDDALYRIDKTKLQGRSNPIENRRGITAGGAADVPEDVTKSPIVSLARLISSNSNVLQQVALHEFNHVSNGLRRQPKWMINYNKSIKPTPLKEATTESERYFLDMDEIIARAKTTIEYADRTKNPGETLNDAIVRVINDEDNILPSDVLGLKRNFTKDSLIHFLLNFVGGYAIPTIGAAGLYGVSKKKQGGRLIPKAQLGLKEQRMQANQLHKDLANQNWKEGNILKAVYHWYKGTPGLGGQFENDYIYKTGIAPNPAMKPIGVSKTIKDGINSATKLENGAMYRIKGLTKKGLLNNPQLMEARKFPHFEKRFNKQAYNVMETDEPSKIKEGLEKIQQLYDLFKKGLLK